MRHKAFLLSTKVANSSAKYSTGKRFVGLLIASSCLASLGLIVPTAGYTQQQATVPGNYNIPAQPLSSAIATFIRISGWEVGFTSQAVKGKRSTAVNGSMAPAQALHRLLQGTGVSASISGASTAALVTSTTGQKNDAQLDDGGGTILDTITVTGGASVTPSEEPYYTAAPADYISSVTIERYRGSSPADIFRGTPSVMSGEARNGAGAIDVNIRGMQGMGRVTTTVDGAENSLSVYQGYQGVSNRTYVDPDFIGGIDITKGSDTQNWGNAGSVAMRTVNADDIIKPGNNWGIRVKGEVGTNSSTPHAGDKAGYYWPATPYDSLGKIPILSATGMDRPSAFSPTRGSGSMIAAYKDDDRLELLVGYAQRKQGNYHAGKYGPSVEPFGTGPQKVSWYQWDNYYINKGLVNYRGGEEVLNTQLETRSWLAKISTQLTESQKLQLGYTNFRSEAGDRTASRLTGEKGQATQQSQTAGTSVDSFTARYNWDPEDNDLIHLNANAYWTHLTLRNPIRVEFTALKPETLGLPSTFRVGSDSDLWGADINNLSKFYSAYGDIDLTYGVSYRGENTRGSKYSDVLDKLSPARDAIRHEAAAYIKSVWSPTDWLKVNSGLRYSHFWTEDRIDPEQKVGIALGGLGSRFSDGGFSPSVGLTLDPLEGVQLYSTYSSTMRAPSIMETVAAFSTPANLDVRPERSNNWELGVNLTGEDVVASSDRAMIKFGYFNWDVKDYIGREADGGASILKISNFDRARFSGLEFSSRYENDGFTADLSANYFLGVEYCKTANSCVNKTTYADYATNHVQPKYMVNLSLSQKLLEERLTLGGRVTHIGPRAVGHGDVTVTGALEFIAQTRWEPYTLVDLFAQYKVSDSLTADFRVENLFDRFYVDPLGLVTQPGPGRTFYAGLTGSFGGETNFMSALSFLPNLRGNRNSESKQIDWTGLYVGAHAGGGFGTTWGRTTSFDGSYADNALRESADDVALNGAMFGLQAGYNWQFKNGVILGLEANASKFYGKPTKEDVFSLDPTLAKDNYRDASIKYDIDWIATLQPKVGYAFNDRFMAYASGGLALLKESQYRTQYKSNAYSSDQPFGYETDASGVESASKTRIGYTLGSGLEYALNEHWSIRGDYSYSRFGKTNIKFDTAKAGTSKDYTTNNPIGEEVKPPILPPDNEICVSDPDDFFCKPYTQPVYEQVNHQGSSSITNGRKAANSLDMHTFKVGLNYRF